MFNNYFTVVTKDLNCKKSALSTKNKFKQINMSKKCQKNKPSSTVFVLNFFFNKFLSSAIVFINSIVKILLRSTQPLTLLSIMQIVSFYKHIVHL